VRCGNEAVDLPTFRALLTPQGRALLDRIGAYDDQRVLEVGARLRREHPAELVAAAMTQARLRARAVGKFGPDAARLFFTAAGLEQATRAPVAAHRSARFAAHGRTYVADLGCGIGADSLALARAGCSVLAVERDPLTAEVARANAAALDLADRIDVRCADVTDLDDAALTGCDAAFCDPARRAERGRLFAPESWSPPWSFLTDLAAWFPATAAKVAPGIPHGLAPEGVEVEWVSHAGDVVEAVVWWGPLTTGVRRRATLLPGCRPGGFAGAPDAAAAPDAAGARGHPDPPTVTDADMPEPTVRALGRWLHEPDGAVIRAGLVGHVAAAVEGGLVDPTIAYVTSDALVRTPYATSYEVLEAMPFGLKRLRAALRARGVGSVVVKKRGSALDPQALRRQLRLSRDGPEVTVFLTRVAGEPWALLAHRASPHRC
jgi:precorrin-6B methylase 2